ncbi:MAG: HNH endonuclease [Anaerolineae bacterium]
MTIGLMLRDEVRCRARFVCEYCGTSETDAGAELTIDHFCPTSKGGADTLDNLVYCCSRCNEYKQDYWPESASAPSLWHPRLEPATNHFTETEDGALHPLTQTGAATIQRLRLNRPALIARRLRKRMEHDALVSLERYHDIVQSLERMMRQQADLIAEQQTLLAEQRDLLRRLSGRAI